MNNVRLIFVMGVSGTGKSTLAHALACALHGQYIDADDFHSDAAKAVMATGQSIDTNMRQQWLARLAKHLDSQQNNTCVVAYSGLISQQRKQLMAIKPNSLGLLLTGDRALISSRLGNRQGHFASSDMLNSQLKLFEPINADETNITTIPIDLTTHEQVDRALAVIKSSDKPVSRLTNESSRE
ncbi:AAA family ATPase [Thalassotalea sp. LPB0316]|uniref:gluconokinase n=1 Tax=Thalassotalea sp. LPB0316 TaxID=2769490 RepID=UPI0018673D26|nr:AAA family ATPase [Thalassotalea sp. LPB0316]QOL24595.1 AAA family ATPase [Thalassotalea sp. LPB0316]